MVCPPFSLITSCTQAGMNCTSFCKTNMICECSKSCASVEAKKSDLLFEVHTVNKFAYLNSDLKCGISNSFLFCVFIIILFVVVKIPELSSFKSDFKSLIFNVILDFWTSILIQDTCLVCVSYGHLILYLKLEITNCCFVSFCLRNKRMRIKLHFFGRP